MLGYSWCPLLYSPCRIFMHATTSCSRLLILGRGNRFSLTPMQVDLCRILQADFAEFLSYALG